MGIHLVVGFIKALAALLDMMSGDPRDRLVNDPYIKFGLGMFNNGNSGLSPEDYFKFEITKPTSPLKNTVNMLMLYVQLKEMIKIEYEQVMAEIEQMEEEDRAFNLFMAEQMAALALLNGRTMADVEEERLLSQKKNLEIYIAQINALIPSYEQAKQNLYGVQAELQEAQAKLDNVLKQQEQKIAKIYEDAERETISDVQNQIASISRKIDNINERLMMAKNELVGLTQSRGADDPLVLQKAEEVEKLQVDVDKLKKFSGLKSDYIADIERILVETNKFRNLTPEELVERKFTQEVVSPQMKMLKSSMMDEIRLVGKPKLIAEQNELARKFVESNPELSKILKPVDIEIPQRKRDMSSISQIVAESSKEISQVRNIVLTAQQKREHALMQLSSIRNQFDDAAAMFGKNAPRMSKQFQNPPSLDPPSPSRFPHSKI